MQTLKRSLAFAAWTCLLTGAMAGAWAGAARAELRPDKVHVADSKKNQSYIRDGLITGGDKAIDEVVVKDIRRAANPGYERIVIDLEGTHDGEAAAIPRPPFYQISVTPDEKRIVVTIWGKPRLAFDSKRVVASFKKSSVIQDVQLMPRVEENTWSFVFGMKGDSPVEVFELTNPVRIIMDIKGGVAAEHTGASAHHATKSARHAKGSGKAAAKAKVRPAVNTEIPPEDLAAPGENPVPAEEQPE